MPKITAVEPQKTLRLRSGRRFNVYLDGIFAFGADEDLVVEYRLVKGKVLDTSDVEKLLLEAEVGKLTERMYRLWNIRPRSEKEVRDYFKTLSFKRKFKGQEEISSFIIETAVQLMKKKNMLNDLEFAKLWLESRGKKYGINRIKQELYKKGIDKEIIEEVIGGQSKENSEQIARKLIDKKLERWKNLPYLEFKKKAYDFLLRRGFEYEVVNDVIEKFIKRDYNNIRES